MPIEIIRGLFVVSIVAALIIIVMLLFLIAAWKLFVLINKMTCAVMDKLQKKDRR